MRAAFLLTSLAAICLVAYAADDRAAKEEVEFDEAKDAEFDKTIVNEEKRPETDPVPDEVIAAYEEQRDRILKEAEAIGQYEVAKREQESLKVAPYVKYLDYNDWYPISYKCCPAAQNHSCRSYNTRLPCFFDYNYKAWCCPFWPTVYAYNCNCGKCSRVDGDCVSIGKCLRRYSLQPYYAVCYRDFRWWYVQRYYSYLPTSCYCSATCS